MKNVYIIAITSICGLGSFSASAQDLQMVVTPVQESYILGEPVLFNVEIDNLSNDTIEGHFYPSRDEALSIASDPTTVNDSGLKVKLAAGLKVFIGEISRIITLQPHAHYEESYCLSPYALITKPGRLQIPITRAFAKLSKTQPTIYNLKNNMLINVTDYDEKALTNKLQDLSNSITESKSPLTQQPYIDKLCQYTDALAIPFILNIYGTANSPQRREIISMLSNNLAIGNVALNALDKIEWDTKIKSIIENALKEISQ